MKQEKIMRAADAVPTQVRRWRIHLGAHKTATTHLQETLAAVRPALAARGIDFIPNQLIRGQGLAPELRRRRRFARLPLFGRSRMREILEGIMDPVRLGPETVVFSEENIVGVPQQVFSAPFYPQAGVNVARLASLGQRSDLVLFLSIRSCDTLLPSAYAEALKHAPPPPGGFERWRERLLAEPPSWFDLVARIRAAVPDVPLKIWRQEDYRANAQEIMQELCGCELAPLPAISDPVWTRSPSARAVAEVEALPRDLPQASRRRRVGEIYAASAPGGDRFMPFGAMDCRRLRAAYDADTDRIAQSYPDLMLRFTPKELAA